MREFLMLLRGLSEHSVYAHWASKQPPEVVGEAAVTALVDRM